MTVSTFGVTALIVRADYLPQINEFTTDSNPTLASVNRFIDQKAGVLEAKLLQESIVASAITIATDAAYLWCQATLTLMVAIRAGEVAYQQNPDILKAWREELNERFNELAARGYLALGGGVAAPAEQPNGPTTFIDNLGIDTSENDANPSSVTFPFRKDDQL